MLGIAAATHSSSPIALWYLTRATGLVTLVLLTLTVALGVANAQRLRSWRIPRFVIDGVHRNAALLAVAFLGAHVATAILDSYAHVNLMNALIPSGAGYKPLWISLGALSLDLFAAVIVTSLLRRRLGYRLWRATHWLAYASWPVALFHSLGAGTDAGSRWMLAIAGACVLVVAAAVYTRFSEPGVDGPAAPRVRHVPERDPWTRPAAPRRPTAMPRSAPARRPDGSRGPAASPRRALTPVEGRR